MSEGPSLRISEEIHSSKYRGQGETFREAMSRVAGALSDNDQHYHEFRNVLLDMRFLPGGRVQSAMGSLRGVTPYNCFVAPTVEDTFVDGHNCIMDVAKISAATMRQGGGIGYDFSTLRPRGAWIKKLQSQSSGPISFMEIFDAVCRCVASSGHRRGAQMGVLRVDHPDIEEFIHAKQNQTRLTGFNISVGVTDKFMECLDSGKPFPLTFEGETYREVDPAALWDTLMRSTWDWAEPGVLFIDTINKMNNLHYCEKIAATNPCGEQPLPPNGACLLGSFNLVKYVTASKSFDFDQFKADIYHVVRAMDNVVDRAKYPLYEQEKEAKNKRRMGLGVTGLANAVEAMHTTYGDKLFLIWENEILKFLNQHCYRASAQLAKEKGSFPLYDKVRYLGGKFIRTLDDETQDMIDQMGIRNSHLTSIAPTGTISLTADNVSSGIEPVFAHAYDRTVQTFDGPIVESVTDYGLRVFGVRGKPSSDVTVQEHLSVLLTAQKNVDSAVSKTCNVGDDVSWDQFKTLYTDAYKGGAKGCTTFRASGKRMGILKKKEDEPTEGASCKIDPVTGRRDCE